MITRYNKPKFVTYNISKGYTINAFVHTNTINNTTIYESIEIETYGLTYDIIVSKLIEYKYSQDQITAITLNYLLTLHEEVLEPEKVKEYQQDYKELQEYRAACKAEAKRAIEYVKEN